MTFSATFIRRPIATVLLAIGLLAAGSVAYQFLPISPLPSVDIPTIVVFAARPGADPETMATSISAPLERHLGEIAGVTEITSISATGSATVIVQFDLSRNIDGAAHDVQAAINAAATDLPAELPTRPYFRKFNPAEAPVMTIALTSDTLSTAQVYDVADSILGQRLSQVEGVSQVQVNGADKPAVRVRLDPNALAAAGLSGQDVYTAVRAANVTSPTGGFQGALTAETIGTNGQLSHAKDYRGLVVKQTGNAVLRLSDVAAVVDGVANARLAAWFGKRPAILLTITKAVDANVIETVDGIRDILPLLHTWMPPDVQLTVLTDRTQTIRASVDDVQYTLLLTVGLVLIVVRLFMGRLVPTIAAGVTVPLSIAGTLAAMWFCGFALDNFSLMALTISVGFVVDDAIVMIENIVRHMERGETAMQAALNGARQISFTVMSISISLVAVFIPLLFMGGILGRLFHEFAATLTIAIATSAVVSLSLTPMLCARFMGERTASRPRRRRVLEPVDAAVTRGFAAVTAFYARTLEWALRLHWLMLGVTIGIVGLTVWMYTVVPKGFLPTQDTGLLQGSTVADPDVSFQAMAERQRAVVDVLLKDPAIDTIGSTIGVSSGFNSLNRGSLTIGLKPLAERGVSSEQVINRLRPALTRLGGIQTFLFSAQDLRGGGRQGGSNQFVLLDSNLAELRDWTQKLEDKLRTTEGITDVSSDQDRSGPQVDVMIDRETAARLGVNVSGVDNALNNAFAQRQVSIIYTDRNQYRVIEEADPILQTDPSYLSHIYVGATYAATGTVSAVSSSGTGATTTATLTPGAVGTSATSSTSSAGGAKAGAATGVVTGTGSSLGAKQVPLPSLVRFVPGTAPLAVRHQGQYPAATITFNVTPGLALGTALERVRAAADALHMPETVRTEFAGNARYLNDSLKSQPMLIAAAFLAIYIVLGVLYESLTQPLTIISTLPSAGLGALIALYVTNTDLSVMGIIGILLLMGIVKKNAIMLVDFALEEERQHGRTPSEAIHAACLERFRPIIMTTLAALLGALPLAFSFGTGAELRQPLGISIAGGLIVSQILTLYTTPVVYLALQPRRRRKTKTVGSQPSAAASR